MSQTTAAAPAEAKLGPPYLSYRTLRNYLDALSLVSVPPNRIDRSVLGNLSGLVQSQLLSTMRYLGLIRLDGTPTDGLRALIKAEGEERKGLMVIMLKTNYPFLFGDFNLSGATPGQLRERFEAAGVSGDTTRKSVSFFLAAAKDAGLPISTHLTARTFKARAPRQKRTNGNAMSSAPAGAQQPPPSPPPQTEHKTTHQVLWEMLDTNAMSEDEQQAVWILMRYLKNKGGGS